MKNGIFAVYHGKEYTSGKNQNGKYILRSTDRNDLMDGFQECEPFRFRNGKDLIVCYKYVEYNELEEYYSIRTIANYKGFEFQIVDEDKNKISIVTMVGDIMNGNDLE